MEPISDDLRKMRGELGFEVWALRRAQEQLTEWDQAGHSARPWEHPHLIPTLDSFLVHARSLIYFFYPGSNAHRDDLLPGHFFVDRDVRWPHSRSTIPAHVDVWRDNINSALQHLSRRRPRPVTDWQETVMRQHFDELFAEFNALGPTGGVIEARHPDSTNQAG